MFTRRSFMQLSGLWMGGMACSNARAETAPGTRLVDSVLAACRRLAPMGWRDMLLEVTAGELDIYSVELGEQLLKPLTKIDRTYPGFTDFSTSGNRAIEPGEPDLSLLYHAFASPLVTRDRSGSVLADFPTLAEIEVIENYVYGAHPPSISHIRSIAAGRPVGVVVFALQYLPASRSVHGVNAELCFSRAGICRIGDAEPLYDAQRRNFTSEVADDPFRFRVMPRRFAAFIAVKTQGHSGNFGPQDPQDGDENRAFWVPLQKLFSGPECINGRDLRLTFSCGLRNEALANFHRLLQRTGLKTEWREADLESHPFVLKDEELAALSRRSDFGSCVLEPANMPLVRPAYYKGKPLTFFVDPQFTRNKSKIQTAAWKNLVTGEGGSGDYADGAAQDYDRTAPQYVNLRHRVNPGEDIDDLTKSDELADIIAQGGYDALHFINGCGDGWVEARYDGLDGLVESNVPAYAMIGMPDFYPLINQRELMHWWKTKVPASIRTGLFTVPPLALSQMRMAANINLPAAFAIGDDTVPAVVSQFKTKTGEDQPPDGTGFHDKVGLPDGSPGIFDPGWDGSQRLFYQGPDLPVQKYLAADGMSAPWTEDAKLCAALGAYWPGVAPDSTRTFPPDKTVYGPDYPWATTVPMTDSEIGITPTADGRFLPWDGVRGPQVITSEHERYILYQDMSHIDYASRPQTLTAALTRRIDFSEYTARILAMATAYRSLGIRDEDFVADAKKSAEAKIISAKAAWSVLSFTKDVSDLSEFAHARAVLSSDFDPRSTYRIHVCTSGEETVVRNVTTPSGVIEFGRRVEINEEAIAYVNGNKVMLQRNGGHWLLDTTMPM
jgi:hypothetical protein